MKLSAEARKVFSRMGKRGGTARAAALSPKKRKAIAKKAAQARWAPKTDGATLGTVTLDHIKGED